MLRYFFHLFAEPDPILDQDGTILSDDAAALAYAVGCIRSFASDCILSGEPVRLASYITIQCEDGREIHRVNFYEVIRFLPGEEVVPGS